MYYHTGELWYSVFGVYRQSNVSRAVVLIKTLTCPLVDGLRVHSCSLKHLAKQGGEALVTKTVNLE